jgi:hypothetical protein
MTDKGTPSVLPLESPSSDQAHIILENPRNHSFAAVQNGSIRAPHVVCLIIRHDCENSILSYVRFFSAILRTARRAVARRIAEPLAGAPASSRGDQPGSFSHFQGDRLSRRATGAMFQCRVAQTLHWNMSRTGVSLVTVRRGEW